MSFAVRGRSYQTQKMPGSVHAAGQRGGWRQRASLGQAGCPRGPRRSDTPHLHSLGGCDCLLLTCVAASLRPDSPLPTGQVTLLAVNCGRGVLREVAHCLQTSLHQSDTPVAKNQPFSSHLHCSDFSLKHFSVIMSRVDIFLRLLDVFPFLVLSAHWLCLSLQGAAPLGPASCPAGLCTPSPQTNIHHPSDTAAAHILTQPPAHFTTDQRTGTTGPGTRGPGPRPKVSP